MNIYFMTTRMESDVQALLAFLNETTDYETNVNLTTLVNLLSTAWMKLGVFH
jgi:hypothetical protein